MAWYKPRADLDGCMDNLKRIGTALDMCSTDNRGPFPGAGFCLLPRGGLLRVTPNYLRSIAICPAAGGVTWLSDKSGSEIRVCILLEHQAEGEGADIPRAPVFHTFSRSDAQDLRNALRQRGPAGADCEPLSTAEGAPLGSEDSKARPSA